MAYKEGSQTGNLLFGLGGRILGGAVGYLAGGFGGASTGWQVGGSIGDSFAKPVSMNQTSFMTKSADPNLAYAENRLDNRMFGYTENKNQMNDWSKYITTGLDAVVNIGSATGLVDKLDKNSNQSSLLGKWFGSNKSTKVQSEADQIIASSMANRNMTIQDTTMSKGNISNNIISPESSLYNPWKNNSVQTPQYAMPDLSGYSLPSQARYLNNRYNKFGQFDHLIQ